MKGREAYIERLKTVLGDRVSIREGAVPNEVSLSLRQESLRTLPEICSLLTESLDAHFTTLVANDERTLNGNLCLYYVFSVAQQDYFLIHLKP